MREYSAGVTVHDIAGSIGKRLQRDAVGAVLGDGAMVDVHTPLTHDVALRIVTVGSAEGLALIRHSAAHLLASAVQKLYPSTQVTIGPAIDTGFYYDFVREGGFTPEELITIEKEMQVIASRDERFVRETVTRPEAEALFREMGETYKLEILAGIDDSQPLTLYRHGDWVDLCRGPHVPRTGMLKAFRLTQVAGAYWRGDEKNPMLARIYGTAFWDKAALDAHMANIEEAKRRDHRKLGKELDLFSFHPVAPAMPFFHPAGTSLYNRLQNFVRQYYERLGFEEVITPQIFDTELFRKSGHLANYKDNMFFTKCDDREFGVKPMNCPGHTLIYANTRRSYRDLPIRYADFGRLHRYERSGVTAGLTRVRSFCQDDAHIFCREDQVGDEIGAQLRMIAEVYRQFDFKMKVGFSTRPEQSLGREPDLQSSERDEWDVIWHNAEGRLRSALEEGDVSFQEDPGEGAFYGPKIDFQVQDAIGRWHQLGTIQLDFGLPKRFDLKYTAEDGSSARPVMIHRAVLGSLERFIGILIEHTAGDFPLWLAPTQVRVLTISDAHMDYGAQIVARMKRQGLRATLDTRSEKLGFKIRDAELGKIPVVFVCGPREVEANEVAIRWRKKGNMGSQPLDQAIQTVLEAAAVPRPSESLVLGRA